MPAQVNLADPSTTAITAFGTNIQQADELAPPSPKAQAVQGILQTWQPALVRLHFGVHGDTFGSLPESVQGRWDFGHLDAAVAALRALHQPVFLNVRSAPAWMFNNQGQLRDPTFREFATYMARLVGWYNMGGFTDDAGNLHVSGHYHWISTWEIWNEPNSGFEIPAPVPDPAATWMQPEDFARLYNVTVAAMRAVDPSIQTGGPAVSSYPDNPYIRTFLHDVTEPLDFLSLHFYGIYDQQMPDAALFADLQGLRLLERILAIKAIVQQEKPGQSIPLWIDELGFNENSRQRVDPRGTSPVAFAYVADTFTLLEQQQVALFGQFPTLGNAQQSLVDWKTHRVYPIFWLYAQLTRSFPPGMKMLPVHLPNTARLSVLATLTPDMHSLRLLIGNSAVQSPDDNNGKGISQSLCLMITGARAGIHTVAHIWQFDAQTGSNAPPSVQNVALNQSDVALTLPGYSATVLDILLQ